MIRRKPRLGEFSSALLRAGRFQMARDQLLIDARYDKEARSFKVAHARAAHRAYLASLTLARRLSGKPEHVWT